MELLFKITGSLTLAVVLARGPLGEMVFAVQLDGMFLAEVTFESFCGFSLELPY